MTGGQYFTPRQKSIVNRFYAHADTRVLATLQELVSDLALADPASKEAAKAWTRTREWLAKAGTAQTEIARVCDARNVKALAELVGTLAR